MPSYLSPIGDVNSATLRGTTDIGLFIIFCNSGALLVIFDNALNVPELIFAALNPPSNFVFDNPELIFAALNPPNKFVFDNPDNCPKLSPPVNGPKLLPARLPTSNDPFSTSVIPPEIPFMPCSFPCTFEKMSSALLERVTAWLPTLEFPGTSD